MLGDRLRALFGPSRPTPEGPPAPQGRDSPAIAGDFARVLSLTAEQLAAIENAGVSTVGRADDRVEAIADERQDPATSASFPLHWSCLKESWDYLFDIAIAGSLLAPRPDDLVLDAAAGTGWATELLNRVGVRTVSIDLSLEMMRRGRSRLASDSRLVFRDDAAWSRACAPASPSCRRRRRRRVRTFAASCASAMREPCAGASSPLARTSAATTWSSRA